MNPETRNSYLETFTGNLSFQRAVIALNKIFTQLSHTYNYLCTMAKETKRQKQVGELVKRHFSSVLQQEGGYIYGHEPLVTVTSVKMSADLGLAKIYLSIYNTENKQAVILEMEAAYQKLRQTLSQRIRKHVRRIPDIAFYMDETIDEMYRVDNLFQRLYDENQMGDDREEEEE